MTHVAYAESADQDQVSAGSHLDDHGQESSGSAPRKRMTYLVCAYDEALRYGGPEEGGWWYVAGSLVRVCKAFRSEDRAYAYARRLNARLQSSLGSARSDGRAGFGPNAERYPMSSVRSDGELVAVVMEDWAPKGYPESRPRYE